jgi:hypothetical protein
VVNAYNAVKTLACAQAYEIHLPKLRKGGSCAARNEKSFNLSMVCARFLKDPEMLLFLFLKSFYLFWFNFIGYKKLRIDH